MEERNRKCVAWCGYPAGGVVYTVNMQLWPSGTGEEEREGGEEESQYYGFPPPLVKVVESILW